MSTYFDIPFNDKARSWLRDGGFPWPHGSLELDSGPHLFLDWRFVFSGEIGMLGPYWADANGTRLGLNLWDDPALADKNVVARYVDRDLPRGVRIAAQPAQRVEPFPADGPPGRTIRLWDGWYHTWYKRAADGGKTSDVHIGGAPNPMWHARSPDGYHWQDQRQCAYDSADCPDVAGDERLEIFVDPSAEEAERYKMFFRAPIPGGAAGSRQALESFKKAGNDAIYPIGPAVEHLEGMWGAVSPDGISWKGLPGPLIIHFSDTSNVVCYDQLAQRYVWYCRTWYFGRRCIGRAETDDFRHWPLPERIIWPTTDLNPADDWYTNSKTIYPECPGQHLMFPALYHHADDSSELLLYSSSDGTAWSPVPGGPVLIGEPGAWDGGCVFGGTDLIPLGKDQVALPYGGYTKPHKYPRNRRTFGHQTGFALWPRGRLAAIEAADGSFTTVPMHVSGNALHLNLQTKAAGHVLVEVVGQGGKALPGFSFADADPLVGDDLDREVTWHGAGLMKRDKSRPLMLRFRMQAAKLFSFEFR